jgi:poly-gamma-glutamate synthesis protein (capsule biosynthesis protein)
MTNERSFNLAAVGDICLADSAFCIGMGARSEIRNRGHLKVVRQLRPFFDGADIVFGNLEAIHSNVGWVKTRLGSSEMRGNPNDLDLLQKSGFNVLNIANNHIFQHGLAAYKDNLEQLTKRGMHFVGHENGQNTNRVTLDVARQKVILIGYSLRPEQYQIGARTPYSWRDDEHTIIEEVRRISDHEDNATIVCSLHWGHEFVATPSKEQQQLGRRILDAGASLILGHHPHVVQAIEEYNGGLIAYSLGNFIFDLREPPTLETGILNVTFQGRAVTQWEWKPARIGSDFFPELLTGSTRDVAYRQFSELCTSLIDSDLPAAAELKTLEQMYSKKSSYFSYRFFAKNIHRYDPSFAIQSVCRSAMRKLGLAHDP